MKLTKKINNTTFYLNVDSGKWYKRKPRNFDKFYSVPEVTLYSFDIDYSRYCKNYHETQKLDFLLTTICNFQKGVYFNHKDITFYTNCVYRADYYEKLNKLHKDGVLTFEQRKCRSTIPGTDTILTQNIIILHGGKTRKLIKSERTVQPYRIYKRIQVAVARSENSYTTDYIKGVFKDLTSEDKMVNNVLTGVKIGMKAVYETRCGRTYHPVKVLRKVQREKLKIDGEKVIEFDCNAIQPSILIRELEQAGCNLPEYVGKDFYSVAGKKLNICNRTAVKNLLVPLLHSTHCQWYSKNYKKTGLSFKDILKRIFGEKGFEVLKRLKKRLSDKFKVKYFNRWIKDTSFSKWLLMSERGVMQELFNYCINSKIKFLDVNDSIIIKVSDVGKLQEFTRHMQYFRFSI